ncbi:MAG TPA: glycosyltransferase family 2 protein [Alphaproteobacteria bacterium]|jgi:ceramide glucosyltransferase
MPPLEAIGLVLLAIWLGALAFHIASVAAALTQASFRRRRAADTGARPPVSIIVPTRETGPAFRQRLAELASLAYPDFEIIVASERREPEVEAALAALAPERAARVRTSIDATRHSFNPKVNVQIAAYRAAAHDLIFMTDDNVRSPPDRIDSLLPYLGGEVGLVSAAAIGVEPEGLVAEIEAAYMNGYGARFLLGADRIGRSIAMGKTLLFRRADLDRAGGILALTRGMAEDSVIRESLAAIGFTTVLAPMPALQPLGRRRFADMFARQLRWMAARRWHTPFAFWSELLLGFVVAGVVGGGAVALLLGGDFVLGLAGTWGLWLSLDLACTRALGWPVFWRYPLAWTLRELLLPAMWLLTLTKRSVAWRGNEVPLRPRIAALGQD